MMQQAKILKPEIATLLCASILFVATAEANEPVSKLTIPYSSKEVGHCYERLKETLPVYQDGISKIRSEMESNRSFDQRLKKVLSLHEVNLEKAQTQESPHTWNEEDIYLCVLYDMLEAMYAAESACIAAESGTPSEKQKRFDALTASIDTLPFQSPQYRGGIRPRLQRAVSDRASQLENQK